GGRGAGAPCQLWDQVTRRVGPLQAGADALELALELVDAGLELRQVALEPPRAAPGEAAAACGAFRWRRGVRAVGGGPVARAPARRRAVRRAPARRGAAAGGRAPVRGRVGSGARVGRGLPGPLAALPPVERPVSLVDPEGAA